MIPTARWGRDMAIGSTETEGRHRGSAASRAPAPIEELGGDGGSEAGEIDVVVKPRQINERFCRWLPSGYVKIAML